MTVRLQMKLGVVAETERLSDSPDTTLVVEPTIGSTARSKGNLYLLVTGAGGRKLRDATRMAAEKVRDDYYYDESAGIAVCLKKAIRAANKRLLHSNERLITHHGEAGPIGLALAVVRGSELYVATVGPAEAYLVRQARLLTLPDPSPESGLPSEDAADPEVWHGEIVVGDCLLLMSPNVTRRLGLAPIQDAVVQLHPQAAVEQIHRQFGSGGLVSSGGDGIIAIEAAEVGATTKRAPLKPVWPSNPNAGKPDRGPIPLADTVNDGLSAVQTSAKRMSKTADGIIRRGFYGVFDLMPRRNLPRGRVTSAAIQRERQQRAAMAVMGLLLIVTLVGGAFYFFAGRSATDSTDRQNEAQKAHDAAQADLFAVYGNGRNLVLSDPTTAYSYLDDAYLKLQDAQNNGYSAAAIAGDMAKVISGLNIYFGVTYVTTERVFSFGSDNLGDVALGPDGAAYVIDQTDQTVYRVDVNTHSRLAVAYLGENVRSGGIVGHPVVLATGGQDVLILDDFNNVWRWRPAVGATSGGAGVLIRLDVPDSNTWGSGVRALGTYITNPELGQYNLYVVVPGSQQVLRYPEAPDGSRWPALDRGNYLKVAQDVSQVDDMYVDGSVYLVDGGKVTRYDLGNQVHGWTVDTPGGNGANGDKLLRPTGPFYTKIAADNPSPDTGNFYAYDGYNRRVVEFKKADGTFVAQFMPLANSPRFSAIKGMFVMPGPNGSSPTLYWIESGDLMRASLAPNTGPGGPTQPPAPTATPPFGTISPGPSVKPSATAKH